MPRATGLLGALLVACSGGTAGRTGSDPVKPPARLDDKPAETAKSTKTPVPPPEPKPEPKPFWARDEFCPTGTERVGEGPPGGVLVRCETSDGRLHGPFHLWWKNGKKRVETSYERGLEHGPFRQWDDDGTRVATGAYDKGHRHGPWTIWYRGGTVVRAKGIYDHGARTGAWAFRTSKGVEVADAAETKAVKPRWYRTKKNRCPAGAALNDKPRPIMGELRCQAPDLYGHGRASEWHIHYDNRPHLERAPGEVPNDKRGRLAHRGRYRSGRKHGTWQHWNRRGRRTLRAEWRDGLAIGTWVFYRGGRKVHTAQLDARKPVAYARYSPTQWDKPADVCPEGTKLGVSKSSRSTYMSCAFPGGMRHGPGLTREKGLPYRSSSYYAGLRHGEQRSWFKGKLYAVEHYWHGSHHGIDYRQSLMNDRSRTTTVFREGSKLVEITTTGDVTVANQYRLGRKHGVITKHYATGPVYSTTTYVRGTRHGPYYHWQPDGRPAETGLYERGRKVGKWISWNYYTGKTSVKNYPPPKDKELTGKLKPIKAQEVFSKEAWAMWKKTKAVFADLGRVIAAAQSCDDKASAYDTWIKSNQSRLEALAAKLSTKAMGDGHFLGRMSMEVFDPFRVPACKKHKAFDQRSSAFYRLVNRIVRAEQLRMWRRKRNKQGHP
jgi:antitoxin component YwqK of YwqJK toxin-antitoxin module